MLSVKHYPAEYIDAGQARFDRTVSVLERSVPAAGDDLTDMVHFVILGLDMAFVHRMRGNEGKDGNPLNEVRMLTNSILSNGGVLAAETTIGYRADQAVLGVAIGDPIAPSTDDLRRLGHAYFDTIRQRFGPA